MTHASLQQVHLTFRLEVDDGWPPVAAEGIPCFREPTGFRVRVPPLFIKDLSVNDVIEILDEENGQVWSWKHIKKSAHSTVWVMTFGITEIEQQLSRLCREGLNVARLPDFGLFALDMPPTVRPALLDECFDIFTEDQVSVVYPSWRHDESGEA